MTFPRPPEGDGVVSSVVEGGEHERRRRREENFFWKIEQRKRVDVRELRRIAGH